MATQPSHKRKLEAVKIVVRIEQMKERDDRDLNLDSILERAAKIDRFAVKFTSAKGE